MPSSLGTIDVPCPACGRPVAVTVNLAAPKLDDERCIATIEADGAPIREHIAAFHSGPDGDGGEPLPVAA